MGASAAPGEWGEAGPIGTGQFHVSSSSDLAVGAGGDAIAVWVSSNGTVARAVGAHYAPGVGWSEPRFLDDGVTDAQWIRAAVDGRGNGFAVWQGAGMIWAVRFVAGNGWGLPVLLDAANAAEVVAVATDRDGNAVVAWNSWNQSSIDAVARAFSPSGGWGPLVSIGPDQPGFAQTMDVGFGRGGEAVVVWQETPDGSTMEMWEALLDPAAGWQPAVHIAGNATLGVYLPQVSGNLKGDFCIAWLGGGIRQEVWGMRYSSQAGFAAPTLLEPENTYAEGEPPAVAADSSGTCTVAWATRGTGEDEMMVSRQAPGGAWSAASHLQTGVAAANAPSAAADDQGNVVVAWQEYAAGQWNSKANWFVAGSGWVGEQPIEHLDNLPANGPRIGLDAKGTAVAVWFVYTGSIVELWSSTRTEDFPPSLTIASPLPGASTNQSSIWVQGTTEPGAAVEAAGARAAVDAGGAFRLLVPLEPGVNSILVTSTDAAGNGALMSVDVVFEDPLPDLEGTVATLDSRLAAAVAAAAEAAARLTALEGNLTATADDLEAARAEAAAANATAAALQGALASAQADLAAVRSEANSTRAALNSTTADLSASMAAQARLQSDLAATNATVAHLQAQPAAPGDPLALVLAAAALAVAVAAVVLPRLAGRKPPQTPAP